jgi:hypothetical protein
MVPLDSTLKAAKFMSSDPGPAYSRTFSKLATGSKAFWSPGTWAVSKDGIQLKIKDRPMSKKILYKTIIPLLLPLNFGLARLVKFPLE